MQESIFVEDEKFLKSIEINGKYGYIDNKGKVVIPYPWDKAEPFEWRSIGVTRVMRNGRWWFIGRTGEILAPTDCGSVRNGKCIPGEVGKY